MSNPRQAPRRHEWMPNRMFDPATNPFAIQNLLKKEKKEDTPFLLKRDERSVFGYSDDALLNESTIQPAVDFQFDELLDQPITPSSTFHAEVDGQFSSDPIPEVSSAEVGEAPAITAESSETPLQKNTAEPASDDSLTASATIEPDTSDDHFAESRLDATENVAVPTIDSTDVADMADAHFESYPHDASADQDSPTQEPVIDASADQFIEQSHDQSVEASAIEAADTLANPSHDTLADATSNDHHQPIDAEPSVEQPSIITESSNEVHSAEAESNAGLSQSEPAPGLNNEAVNQLIETAREETRVEAHAAGYQEGLKAGLEQAKAEMQADVDEKLAAIDQLVKGLQQLERDPNTLFEPMKKLAMHLAEQLVRGELTQSAQVIARLVDNCLRELAASGEKAVIVHLNPDDIDHYKPLSAQLGDSIVLRPDALLSRGSVRASLDGSVVEDLMDRRVKGLGKSLAQPVASSWRPALATPSAKPTVAPKPASTVVPVTAAIAATLDAQDDEHDNEHDEHDQHDESTHDDDVMFDDMPNDHIEDTQADRNDETHS